MNINITDNGVKNLVNLTTLKYSENYNSITKERISHLDKLFLQNVK
jgi:hypothetical protein